MFNLMSVVSFAAEVRFRDAILREEMVNSGRTGR